MNSLDALIEELEQVALRLRSGDVDPEEAAVLVDRCAELAGRIGSGLDAAARETEGQERLL
jgi:hypothetical protein